MNNLADVILASSTVSLVLLDKLIRKNVITRAEGAAVMADAARRCESVSPTAAQMILAAKAETLRSQ